MHLVVRYGNLRNAVNLSIFSLGRCSSSRYFSSTTSINQSLSPADISLSGSYNPRPQPNPQAKNIAVLGGGITGLTTAFNLTQDIPDAKITIYERQENLGGWINSELVGVDDGEVLFEWGPRTLRPDLNGSGRATLQLVSCLYFGKAFYLTNLDFTTWRFVETHSWHPA